MTQHIKFLICARRKRGDTQQRYFYEWGNIHVALMLTTPDVMRVFRRYVQHYAITGVTDDMLPIPLSPMQWDNMADHWVDGYEGFLASLNAEGYVQRMQPHVFGDREFVLALTRGTVLYEIPGFRSGGVKLIHWLRSKPGLSQTEFNRLWRQRYAPAFLEAVAGRALVRKYVRNELLDLDAQVFRGSLFEAGAVGGYSGVEELWFRDVESLAQLRGDAALCAAVRDGMAEFVDLEHSFSMVTTERVVYDFVTPSEMSPPPAVLNPDSLEAKVVGQGYRDWNIPRPVEDP